MLDFGELWNKVSKIHGLYHLRPFLSVGSFLGPPSVFIPGAMVLTGFRIMAGYILNEEHLGRHTTSTDGH